MKCAITSNTVAVSKLASCQLRCACPDNLALLCIVVHKLIFSYGRTIVYLICLLMCLWMLFQVHPSQKWQLRGCCGSSLQLLCRRCAEVGRFLLWFALRSSCRMKLRLLVPIWNTCARTCKEICFEYVKISMVFEVVRLLVYGCLLPAWD